MHKLSSNLLNRMKELGIDIELSLEILDRVNKQTTEDKKDTFSLPTGREDYIFDMREDVKLRLSSSYFFSRLKELGLTLPVLTDFSSYGEEVELDRKKLLLIGTLLYPKLAYGILNGGAATSYADSKKNQSFDKGLFSVYEPHIKKMLPLITGRPKGVCPAFYDKNGSPGLSFMALKIRSLLTEALRYKVYASKLGLSCDRPVLPLFQMTSPATHEKVLSHMAELETAPAIRPLMDELGISSLTVHTAIQPLIAAFTPLSEGRPISVFDKAYGKKDEPLALPGGHGQNFLVLADIYRKLREQGFMFIYLTNVDNLGSAVDPVSLAVFALTGGDAGFEFSYRTPVDIKGGVLVSSTSGPLCMDIGAGISRQEVDVQQEKGLPVLFNCATGLFNLTSLTDKLDYIIENLPLRLTEQDKDAGKYSQAEQITWEVMGLLDDIRIFAVDKYRRFLAAKLLSETLLTSGFMTDTEELQKKADKAVLDTAKNLNRGLKNAFAAYYAIDPHNYSVMDVQQIKAKIEESLDA